MEHPSQIILLYSPFPDATTALNAARALLGEKLAACANILAGGTSLYWSGDALTETTETVLLAKTTPALKNAAMDRLATLHPYETPAIIAVEATAPAPYMEWVLANVKTPLG